MSSPPHKRKAWRRFWYMHETLVALQNQILVLTNMSKLVFFVIKWHDLFVILADEFL